MPTRTWTLLRASFACCGFVFVLASSAYAQSQGVDRHAPSALFIPAIVLIGAGALLAYRRSRPTD